MARRRPARLIPVLLLAGPAVLWLAAAPPTPRVLLTDVTAPSGIAFVNSTGHLDHKDYPRPALALLRLIG